MKIEIVSDGTAQNTHVFNEYGEEIKGIAKIDINIEPNKPVTATLVFDRVSLDIIAEENGRPINIEIQGDEHSEDDIQRFVDTVKEAVEDADLIRVKKKTIFEKIADWWRVPR